MKLKLSFYYLISLMITGIGLSSLSLQAQTLNYDRQYAISPIVTYTQFPLAGATATLTTGSTATAKTSYYYNGGVDYNKQYLVRYTFSGCTDCMTKGGKILITTNTVIAPKLYLNNTLTGTTSGTLTFGNIYVPSTISGKTYTYTIPAGTWTDAVFYVNASSMATLSNPQVVCNETANNNNNNNNNEGSGNGGVVESNSAITLVASVQKNASWVAGQQNLTGVTYPIAYCGYPDASKLYCTPVYNLSDMTSYTEGAALTIKANCATQRMFTVYEVTSNYTNNAKTITLGRILGTGKSENKTFVINLDGDLSSITQIAIVNSSIISNTDIIINDINIVSYTQLPNCVEGYVPVNNATRSSGVIDTLKWNASEKATYYKVYAYSGSSESYNYVENEYAGALKTDSTTNTYITINISSITNTYWKVVPCNEKGCRTKTCDILTIIPYTSSANLNLSKDTTACDSVSGMLALTIAEGVLNPTVKWEHSLDGVNYTILSGETSKTYQYRITGTSTNYYRCRVASGTDTVLLSNVVVVKVNQIPQDIQLTSIAPTWDKNRFYIGNNTESIKFFTYSKDNGVTWIDSLYQGSGIIRLLAPESDENIIVKFTDKYGCKSGEYQAVNVKGFKNILASGSDIEIPQTKIYGNERQYFVYNNQYVAAMVPTYTLKEPVAFKLKCKSVSEVDICKNLYYFIPRYYVVSSIDTLPIGSYFTTRLYFTGSELQKLRAAKAQSQPITETDRVFVNSLKTVAERGVVYYNNICNATDDKILSSNQAMNTDNNWYAEFNLADSSVYSIYFKELNTAIEEVDDFNLNLILYPNPVENQMNVKTTLKIDKMEIYDVYGRIIPINIDNTQINTSHLSVGTYFLVVYSQGEKVVKKFVKQ